jgi:hypothetical protein
MNMNMALRECYKNIHPASQGQLYCAVQFNITKAPEE